MPLAKGRSKKVISANIAEMMASFKRTGKIGNIRPRNARHARAIASAAAHSKARRSK
ncbi:hypothetical protein LCGC14_2100450 [marine sediment metagenome]|uniref:Uncharacterized protein n=1 Tax=marine sediment metagenome TaxID=412755 RepID=A0A0F9H6K3_9ZZZZ